MLEKILLLSDRILEVNLRFTGFDFVVFCFVFLSFVDEETVADLSGVFLCQLPSSFDQGEGLCK